MHSMWISRAGRFLKVDACLCASIEIILMILIA
jgi:hypothetical protein